MTPHTLVLDAGPLIALFHAADPDHESAVRGFRALAREHSRLITPLPVVYEVYKWLLFEANALIAQQALGRMMEALEILPLRLDDLEAIQILLLGMQGWRGTLEVPGEREGAVIPPNSLGGYTDPLANPWGLVLP
ncbi:type II toxin-antitoxin system VapC family toxin [Thermus sp. NMX2.A1]|uniref:type II toxin-antitoxin system VapC family toxin n=2 Tax=Thermus TaxID=270 RepID=UPI0003DC5C94|nr:type II toxin-antitoxin system VapC family toxin [Thermus sp. NMX2.A1]ETN89368.1 twitching motility protein PilT [Thermus sp. NMX2.A1]